MPSSTLNYHERALLFKRLASMEHAGIDSQQSLASLASDKEQHLADKCRLTLKKIKTGKPFYLAAMEAGLIDSLESILIKTTQQSGTPEVIYTTLANNYENKARRLRLLKSRLMLPLGLLLLAGFIGPLPQLIIGKITAIAYLFQGAGFAFLILLSLKLLFKLPLWLRKASLADNPVADSIDKLLLTVPAIKRWYIRRAVCQWLELAALLLGSGLSAFETMPLLNNTLISKRIKQAFESSLSSLLQGQTFTDAFSHNPYISAETKHFINSGETSGRLPEMLKHSALLENERLEEIEQQFAEWLPRIIYFLVLFWLASNIIGKGVTSHLDAIP